MRKILIFSASKTLQEKGQNSAHISQKHWEKMPRKVKHRNGLDRSPNRWVPVPNYTILPFLCCYRAAYKLIENDAQKGKSASWNS